MAEKTELDLGEHKSVYIRYFRLKKKYEKEKKTEDETPIKIYQVEKKNDELAFLKAINKEELKQEEDYDFHIEQIKKEKEISYLCNSDYTIRINNDFETERNIVFEKEYCDIDLKENLFQNGPFEKNYVGKNNLQKFKEITIGIAKAMKFINDKGVVHRNIKPHNFYIKNLKDEIYQVKLGDFSCSIYINEINNSEPMGTIVYTAPEIIKSLDYNEKCDMWSVGLTLFEIYFGVLPFGWHPNTKKINDIIYDEDDFVFRKSNKPTLDILFKCLLQIDPDKRMSSSEFYDYVTNENFLNDDCIAINGEEKYLKLHEEILNEEQVDYGEENAIKKEKVDEEEEEKQNLEKIVDLVEESNIPDIMSFSNAMVEKENVCNNIIYYDTNIEQHKTEIHEDSDLFERETPGAFILCSNLDSLKIIKKEIIKARKAEKKVIFNLISNGKGFKMDLLNYIKDDNDFKQCINKICIYCMKPKNHSHLKDDFNELPIEIITKKKDEVIKFIKDNSLKEIKPFPLTKLIRFEDDYLKKYKERHSKVAEFYGNLNPEDFKKNFEKIEDVIDEDKTKRKKENIIEGLLTFDINKDLEALDELIINEYTKNSFYGDLNRWLMKGKMKYYEPVAYFTSRLMFSLNKYAEKKEKFCKENEKELHRGAKLYYSCLLPYERAVGKIILLSAFTSTSESDEIANKWAGRGDEEKIYNNRSKFSVVFHIKNVYANDEWIPNGINIQEISRHKKEKEFLFQPFSFYRVKSVNIDIKKHTADISLETIGKTDILEEQIKNGKSVKYDKENNIMIAE